MTLLIFAGVLLGAMALGMPIAFALMLSSLALMLHLDGIDAQAMALQMINGADSFALLAVPFFILAGEAMTAGGLSRRLVGLGDGAGGPCARRPGLCRRGGGHLPRLASPAPRWRTRRRWPPS